VTSPRRALEFLLDANALEGVKRTGFVMSKVPDPENVAAHTFGVAAAAMLLADRVDEPVDRGRMLAMAVLHDIGEVRVGDVALIHKSEEDDAEEAEAVRDILDGLPPLYLEIYEEHLARETVEARIVKAADKLQMMVKVLAYEREGRGDLAAFWGNPRNFEDAGLPEAAALFAELRTMRGDDGVTGP
jgi:5'-deoxynucleotidase YfbR-like HD superfamily hydrolase